MAPAGKKHKGGVSNKVRKTTVVAKAGTGSSQRFTRVLGMRGMEKERQETSALVEAQIAGK